MRSLHVYRTPTAGRLLDSVVGQQSHADRCSIKLTEKYVRPRTAPGDENHTNIIGRRTLTDGKNKLWPFRSQDGGTRVHQRRYTAVQADVNESKWAQIESTRQVIVMSYFEQIEDVDLQCSSLFCFYKSLGTAVTTVERLLRNRTVEEKLRSWYHRGRQRLTTRPSVCPSVRQRPSDVAADRGRINVRTVFTTTRYDLVRQVSLRSAA